MLQATSNTNITLVNCTFTEIKVPLLTSWRSSVNFINSSFVDVKGQLPIFEARFSKIKFQNTLVSDITTDSESNINFLYTESLEVENSTIEISNNRMINLREADKVILKNSTFSQGQQGFQASKVQEFEIEGCTFSNFSSTIHKGGALLSIDSNLKAEDSIFTNNKATEGGALELECMFDCEFELTDVTFSDNEALVQGGAFSYTKQRPTMSGVTFSNNKAGYGPNIGSYPVNYKMAAKTDLSFSNVGSGSKMDEFSLELLDYDGHIVTIQNTSVVSLKAEAGYDLLGQSISSVTNGVATFNGVTFIGEPGAENIPFTIENSDISKAEIGTILGPQACASLDWEIDVSFRKCLPGEEMVDKQCSMCQISYYSLIPGNECKPCLEFATCEGGNQLNITEGYWRDNLEQSSILKCPNADSCLGGFNEQGAAPINCKEGYEGVLCTDCSKKMDGMRRFMRSGLFQCSYCPHPVMNAIRILLVTFVILCLIGILIWFNIRKEKESQMSILSKIFTNYMQTVTAAVSFNVSYPKVIQDAFKPANDVSQATESILSFDCFLSDLNLNGFASSEYIFKTFVSSFVPLAIITLFVGILVIWKLVRRDKLHITRCIIITVISIIYFLHPSITEKSLSLFKCDKIYETN